ncbi:MAG: NYN domain-containing protein, partial [Oscillospiraceae bacterium]|nr:NYN domain-containing protein [Oscillospiraceae bacterium]
VDFSSEMERSLQVLDFAILVISGTDGVQAHTETLWRLLKQYNVPCFVFITKMDLNGCNREALLQELAKRLDSGCIDFSRKDDAFYEQLAMCSEEVMEKYLEDGQVSDEDIAALVMDRKLFPCFFGSGLKLEGVEELLRAMDTFVKCPEAKDEFAAKVYKIARDAQGNRLTYMKLTGGELKARMPIKYKNEKGEDLEEKVNQIRLYSGIKFDAVDSVSHGQVCAVTGLSGTYPGQGLGAEKDSTGPVLEPVISYTIKLPQQADPRVVLPKLMLLQEEDPQLHIEWNERSREISVQLMGKVQTEIFKSLVKERFDLDIELDSGHIMYRETIADTVEGVGHYEPLRHYAEVHLILEPMPQGSGIVLDSSCSEDALDRNWQRLIFTHLLEKQHLGVLTGSPITDVKITLAAGRAHDKHTEGGDFRQATYRAVRQGLMQAESVLLEPYYSFIMEVPAEQIGRAISDVRTMNGNFSSPEDAGDGFMRIEGSAPVAAMNGYMAEIVSYTHGKGRFSCRPDGYRPCKDQQKIVDEIGYEAESDVDNTPDSVFCAHGAGINIKWNEVHEYMHLESCLRKTAEPEIVAPSIRRSVNIDDRELEAIMEREFGPIRRKEYKSAERNEAPDLQRNIGSIKKEFLIVDGYNLIFAWDELKKVGEDSMDVARKMLIDMLVSYCGYTNTEMLLVFDAYKTAGGTGYKEEYHNLRIAFTKDGETADAYIERIANDIGTNYSVRVITGDSLIRLSTLRSGVLNSSSRAFRGEVEAVLSQIEGVLQKSNEFAHSTRLKDGKQ